MHPDVTGKNARPTRDTDMKKICLAFTAMVLSLAFGSISYAGTAAPRPSTAPPGNSASPAKSTTTKSTDPSTVSPTDRIRAVDPTTDPSSVRPADRIRPNDSTTTPNDPSTRPDGGAIVRPGDLPTSQNRRIIVPAAEMPDDAAMQKNEADFKAAKEQCDAIVSKDSQTSCMEDAETNYRKGRS